MIVNRQKGETRNTRVKGKYNFFELHIDQIQQIGSDCRNRTKDRDDQAHSHRISNSKMDKA